MKRVVPEAAISLVMLGSPHVDMIYKNRVFKMLIDTGAGVSLLKQKCIFEQDLNREDVIVLKGIGKNNRSGLGSARINIELTKGIFNEFKFYIITEDVLSYYDGIIGNDFLQYFGFIIDCESKILRNKSEKLILKYKDDFSMQCIAESVGSNCVNQRIESGNSSNALTTSMSTHCKTKEINRGSEKSIFEYKKEKKKDCLKDLNEIKRTEQALAENQNTEYQCDGKCNPIGMSQSLTQPKCLQENKINDKERRERFLKVLENLRIDHLKEDKEIRTLKEILKEYSDTFSLEEDTLTETSAAEHFIRTINEVPINTKTYRYPKIHEEEVNRQIQKLLADGIIQPSVSPWSSPIWIVPKKSDASGLKKWRMVIDFRKLNEITTSDNYPIPNIQEILDKLGNAKYFTTLDLTSGFHQIPLSKESVEKTAFSTPYGHFEFLRMPFGLKNAPACFQRMMNNVLNELQGKVCFVYLDDIVVFGETLKQHNERLIVVLDRLRKANLKIQLNKSEFLKKEVEYLGHLITNKGLLPNLKKVEAIDKLQEPTNQRGIKSFLGMIGYYRKFVQNFSTIAKPLYTLLKKNVHFNWKQEQKESFIELKNKLKEFTILRYPDFNKEFVITTDASNIGIGAVLSQEYEGKDLPVHFISRTLNNAELNYNTTEKECLAIVWAIQQFRPYIYGKKFKIKTDHRPLTWLFRVKDPGSRLVRWRLKLEEYSYSIEYKKGVDNVVADELSRNVYPIEAQYKNDDAEVQEKIREIFGSDSSDEVEDETILRKIYEEECENLTNQSNNISNKTDAVRKERGIEEISENESEMDVEVVSDRNQQQQIIKENHDGLIGGHGGQKATISRIKEKYFWKGLNKDVIDYVSKCPECQRQKINRNPGKNPMKIVSSADYSLEKVSMDLTGPYKEGNKTLYSLTIQDDLSKYIKYIPIQDKKCETVARAFTDEWILYFGIPKLILTDNGGEFVNDVMKELCKLFKIKHLRTSNMYPQANGSAERSHARLGEYLRLMIKDKSKPEYSKLFRYAAFCHNTTVHSSTGFTPHEVLFGRKANTPCELSGLKMKTNTDYVQELQLKLIRLESDVKRNLLNMRQQAKRRYDNRLGSKIREYKINDYVLIKNDRSDKHSDRYVGPF